MGRRKGAKKSDSSGPRAGGSEQFNTAGSIPGLVPLSLETPAHMVPIIFRGLFSTLPELNDLSKRSSSEEEAGLSALGSLSSIISMRNEEVMILVTPEYEKSWPKICGWARYFYVHDVKPTSITDKDRCDHRRRIVSNALLILFNSNHSFVRQALFKDDMIATITGLWLREDPNVDLTADELPTSYKLMHNMLYLAQADHSTAQSIILREADGKRADVAIAALRPLHPISKDSRHSLSHIRACTNLVMLLMPHRDSPFSLPILSNGGASLLSKAIVITWSRPSQVDYCEEMFGVTQSCFGGLRNALQSDSAATWARSAVSGGLLDALVQCSPSFQNFQEDTREDINLIITQLLPAYLVYRSVLGPVIESLNQLIHAKKLHRIENSPLKDDWKLFLGIVLERAAFLAFRAASGDGLEQCDRCKKVNTKKSFMKCAGCRTTLYCSKECQVGHWKQGGHKWQCNVLEGRLQDGICANPRDEEFLKTLGRLDIQRHMPGLRTLAVRKLRNVPGDEIAYSIDYTRIPPTLDVFCLGELSREAGISDYTKRTRQQLIDVTRASNGVHALGMIVYPNGSMKTRSILYTDIPGNRAQAGADNAVKLLNTLEGVLGKNKDVRRFQGRDTSGNLLETGRDFLDYFIGKAQEQLSRGGTLTIYEHLESLSETKFGHLKEFRVRNKQTDVLKAVASLGL